LILDPNQASVRQATTPRKAAGSWAKPNDHQSQGEADTHRTAYHHGDC
jgi:hypothetical protein